MWNKKTKVLILKHNPISFHKLIFNNFIRTLTEHNITEMSPSYFTELWICTVRLKLSHSKVSIMVYIIILLSNKLFTPPPPPCVS